MGVTEFIEVLQRFMEGFTPVLNKLVIFLLILLFGFMLGKITSKLLHRLLGDVRSDTLARRIGVRFSVRKFLTRLVAWSIYTITLLLALNTLGLAGWFLLILLGAILLSILILLFITLRNFLPNLFAGISVGQELRPGMRVTIAGTSGRITKSTLLETQITAGKDILSIPNQLFKEEKFTLRK